jgi:hypothetical protein
MNEIGVEAKVLMLSHQFILTPDVYSAGYAAVVSMIMLGL